MASPDTYVVSPRHHNEESTELGEGRSALRLSRAFPAAYGAAVHSGGTPPQVPAQPASTRSSTGLLGYCRAVSRRVGVRHRRSVCGIARRVMMSERGSSSLTASESDHSLDPT
jgi:hypothetical protein